jgi:transcriptional regulator with XRE-family HTH domain
MVSRLIVGMALRRLREASGFSREDAGQAIRAPVSKISRLEVGGTVARLREVAGLCAFYGVTDQAELAMLLGLARRASNTEWWHPYRDVIPAWFERYLGLEQAASVIRSYEVQFIPGLLQTADYARAVIVLAHGDTPGREVDRRVELRMRRQHVLSRARPPHLWVLIDEAALRRPVGGRVTMRAQLRYLLSACDIPHVTIQMVPFSLGGHPAGGGPIAALRLPDRQLPDAVYLEQLTSAQYPGSPAEVEHHRHILDRLAVQARLAGSTPAILSGILRDA